MKKIIFVFAFLATLIWQFSVPVLANAPDREVKDYSVKEMITYYANYYGANEKELLAVVKCESNFRTEVYGDGKRAFGLLQYHQPTFTHFASLMGEELDYNSPHDQIKLTAWIFTNYPQYKKHWTCWTSHFKV